MGNPFQPQGASLVQPSPMGKIQHADQKKVDAARKHAKVVLAELHKLAKLPRGELDKKAVFNAVSDMLAKGAFPDQASKQALIQKMTELPNDELGLRQEIGQMIMQISQASAGLDQFL